MTRIYLIDKIWNVKQIKMIIKLMGSSQKKAFLNDSQNKIQFSTEY
jgi:hypothetical protein